MAGYGNYVPSHFQHQEKSSLEAAAEAVAKVNAMLIAKGKLRPNQVHNNQQRQKKPSQSNMVAAEVEINDAPLSMRNMLTRGPTQEEITKFSGAAVSTRGRYMTPVEKIKNNNGERPLYLFVQGPTQESVNVAVSRINEILTGGKGGLGSGGGLVRTSGTGPPPAPNISTQPPPPVPAGLMHMPPLQLPPVHQPPPMLGAPVPPPELQQITVLEERLFIGLEHAPPSFDVKGKILGPGSSYLMHIQTETGARVVLKGKASGYIEPSLGRETLEPMHINIQHPSVVGLQQAKQLAENLIQTVQQMYASFQQALASIPSMVTPGPTAYITGIQQPSSIADVGLLGPSPGLATITAIPDAQLVPSGSGLQPQQTMMVPSSSMSSVMVQAGSMASSIPGISPGQPGTAGMMLPTISVAPVSVVSTMPISTPTHLHLQAAPAGLDLGQQQLIVNQAPPPHSIGQMSLAQQSLGQMSLASQLTAQTSMPMTITSYASLPNPLAAPAPTFNPALHHTMHLVSQAGPSAIPSVMAPPPHIAAAVQAPSQPPPYHTMYSQMQEVVSSGGVLNTAPPVSLVISSAGQSTHIYSMATSNSAIPHTHASDFDHLPRRRFTEEKDEKIPESLLGYQHGPPHLVNLVCPSPPPGHGQPVPIPAPSQPTLMPPPAQGQPPPIAVLQAQPGLPSQPQPGIGGGHMGLQPSHSVLQTFPPGVSTSFALQVQALHSLPSQLPPPPISPASQPYTLPQPSDDNRFGVPVSSAVNLMHLPPPVSSSEPAAARHLMPPPAGLARSESQQAWAGSTSGIKRNLQNGERGSETDRKRKKGDNNSEEEDKGGKSPTAHGESSKPGTPNPGAQTSQSQRYSPSQDHFETMVPPPPSHLTSVAFQAQYMPGLAGQHLLPPPGPQYTSQIPTFDPTSHPPPNPIQQHYIDHAGQPPPPIHYQDLTHQYPPSSLPQGQGELGQFHTHPQAPLHHGQAEYGHPLAPPPGEAVVLQPQHDIAHSFGPPAVSHGEPPIGGHNPYSYTQTYSQPAPQPQYINTPPVYSHSSFHPSHLFLPQGVRHPHTGGPPPPPPPPSSQYQHAPPQAYWHA